MSCTTVVPIVQLLRDFGFRIGIVTSRDYFCIHFGFSLQGSYGRTCAIVFPIAQTTSKSTYWQELYHLRHLKWKTTKGSSTDKCLITANRLSDVTSCSINHLTRLLSALNTLSLESRNHRYRLYSYFTRPAGQVRLRCCWRFKRYGFTSYRLVSTAERPLSELTGSSDSSDNRT